MSYQANLFSDGISKGDTSSTPVKEAPGQGAALTALKFAKGAASADQQRFNRLLTKTEALAQKIESTRNLADAHRPLHMNALRPLEDQRDALMREMAVWLDARLQLQGLTAKQKRIASEIIQGLAADFALRGDESMRALHDAHSSETLAEQEKSQAEDAKAMLEEMLGKDLGAGTDFANMEEVLRASMEHMQEHAQAQEQAKAARKTRLGKSSKAQKPEQQVADADGALRTIFRQLASALHPDREADPHERVRKTALMSEANAAYAKRDLLALLQLQLRADLADGEKIASLAREKIVALTALLKERVEVLTFELNQIERQILAEFGLPIYASITSATLHRHLQEEKQHLQEDILMMKQDFQRVQETGELKRWLREQQELAHERDSFEASLASHVGWP